MNIFDAVRHLFTPTKHNNFRAKLLHHDLLTVYLLCAMAITICVNSMQSTYGSVLGYATDISVKKLFELTNVEREKANLSPLTYNDKLAAAAQSKAKDMFTDDYWAHYSPAGKTPWDFILGSGYQYEYAGENLAKNFLFSQGVVDAWMASPTHKENILRKEYKEVGFAVMNGMINGEETTLVVQMFGSPYYVSETSSEVSESKSAAVEKADAVVAQEYTQLNPAQRVLIPPAPPVTAFSESFMGKYLNFNYIFFTILLIALIFDFYFAAKLKLIHVKGKNIMHILFICFILAGTYIIVRGSII